MSDEAYYARERRRMVEEQLRHRHIRDARVLEAMGSVPREMFVLPEHRSVAYADSPLPIGEGQTISQPYIVALMTEMLALKGDETVLEIGTGSGYQAAILGRLARQVYTIERHLSLGERAQRLLSECGFSNVHTQTGDGSLGWPPGAPYQAIIVTAAAPLVPQPLLEQLDEGGRLVIPVGSLYNQVLECWDRHGNDFTNEAILPVAFVPLRGQFGWKEGVGEW